MSTTKPTVTELRSIVVELQAVVSKQQQQIDGLISEKNHSQNKPSHQTPAPRSSNGKPEIKPLPRRPQQPAKDIPPSIALYQQYQTIAKARAIACGKSIDLLTLAEAFPMTLEQMIATLPPEPAATN